MNAEEFKAAVEAVDLTAVDATAQILELNKGLMNSNTTLLDESKLNKTKAQEANEATEAARSAALVAEEARLAAVGTEEEKSRHQEKKLAESVAAEKSISAKWKDAVEARDKGDVINDILSGIDPKQKAFVKTHLENSVSISYDENGAALVSIKDGDNNYSSAKDFFSGVDGSDTWKHALLATSLSGAGTQQSTTPGSGGKKYGDMSFEERAKFNSQ
jgi:hypothetical protein